MEILSLARIVDQLIGIEAILPNDASEDLQEMVEEISLQASALIYTIKDEYDFSLEQMSHSHLFQVAN